MIKINICGMEYNLDSCSSDMIMTQFRNRSNDGAGFWFRVSISLPDIDISFSSAHCPCTGTPIQRQITHKESQISDLWRMCNAGDDHTPDGLLSFLKKLSSKL